MTLQPVPEDQPHGWLTNPQRKARRNRANTFTDQDAEKLLAKIDDLPHYISPTLKDENLDLDFLMRTRDRSLIALNWIFFKRASEVLGLKRKDVQLTSRELLVTFNIRKKKKRMKICPVCEEKNGFKNRFCRSCSLDLKDVSVIELGETRIITKRKTLDYTFTKPIVDWLREFDKLTDDKEAWFFPPLQVVFNFAFFDFHRIRINKRTGEPYTTSFSIQNYDRILQRLDPTMTSSMFRYGGAEKYLLLGYTPTELKSVGDWDSSRMPEIYAERKDLSVAQRRFAEDTRQT